LALCVKELLKVKQNWENIIMNLNKTQRVILGLLLTAVTAPTKAADDFMDRLLLSGLLKKEVKLEDANTLMSDLPVVHAAIGKNITSRELKDAIDTALPGELPVQIVNKASGGAIVPHLLLVGLLDTPENRVAGNHVYTTLGVDIASTKKEIKRAAEFIAGHYAKPSVAEIAALQAGGVNRAEYIHVAAQGLDCTDPNIVNEAIRLRALGGGLAGGATAAQINEGLRIHALVGNPVANEAQINVGLRIGGAPTVADIDEGIRLGGGTAAEIAESLRLGNGGGLFVGGATLPQVQESLRIHALVGNPVATPAQIIEGLRIGGAPTVADIDEGIRLGGGTAAEIAESLHHGAVAFAGAPASLAQAQEGVRLAGLIGGGGHATSEQIIESLRINLLVGRSAPIDMIDEGLRIQVLTGGAEATQDQLTAGLSFARAGVNDSSLNEINMWAGMTKKERIAHVKQVAGDGVLQVRYA
jgi:hypothetical protein